MRKANLADTVGDATKDFHMLHTTSQHLVKGLTSVEAAARKLPTVDTLIPRSPKRGHLTLLLLLPLLFAQDLLLKVSLQLRYW